MTSRLITQRSRVQIPPPLLRVQVRGLIASGGQAFLIIRWRFVGEIGPHTPPLAVTNRTTLALRKADPGERRGGSRAGSGAPPCGGLTRRRLPGAVGYRTTVPVGSGNSGQFAALTAGQDEVALRAGPLRAIAVWPQVGLPASRALVASTSLKIAHLTHRSRRPPSWQGRACWQARIRTEGRSDGPFTGLRQIWTNRGVGVPLEAASIWSAAWVARVVAAAAPGRSL